MAIGRSLDRVLRGLRNTSAHALTGVFGGWERIVGPQVAANVTPVKLEDGVLVVAVRDPGWATQMRYLEPTLVGRITAELGPGVVRAIETRVRRS